MQTSNIRTSTIKIECGDQIGTAFFVSENLLLTAYHSIVGAIYGCDIIMTINNNAYKCEIYCSKEGVDFALLKCLDYKHTTFLSLLRMPLVKEHPFKFFGYPDSRIGQVNGLFVDFISKDSIDLEYSNDFDIYGQLDYNLPISIFEGFSGSPVYIDSGYVVGIVTDRLDVGIGFLSIDCIYDELKSKGLAINDDYKPYISLPYGLKHNQKQLEETIKLAGSRYDKSLHQENTELNDFIDKLVNLKRWEKLKQEINDIDNKIKDIIKKYKIVLPSEVDLDIDILEDSKGFLLGFYTQLAYLNSIKSDLNNDDRDLLLKSILFLKENNPLDVNSLPQVAVIRAMAGRGKTHYMCHIAESLISQRRVYLVLGSQFENISNEQPENQLQKLLDFPDFNFLEKLNDDAITENTRYLFIIDALNEGAGNLYWKDKIRSLNNEFKKYSNLVLVYTIRTPLVDSFNFLEDDIPEFFLKGFGDVNKAKKAYFEKYSINKNEVVDLREFENPLFLRIFCYTYASTPLYYRKDMRSYLLILCRYIEERSKSINSIIDEDPYARITHKYLLSLARHSVLENNCLPIERERARKLEYRLLKPMRPWSQSLLKTLLDENLLLSDLSNRSGYRTPTVMFEYERLEDMYKALAFLKEGDDQNNKLDFIAKLLEEEHSEKTENFISALFAIWSEYYEGDEVLNYDQLNNPILKQLFINSLDFRKEPLGNEGIDTLFNQGFDFRYIIVEIEMIGIDTLKLIHEKLLKLSLSERDLIWTSTINKVYTEENVYRCLSTIHDCINRETNNSYYLFIIVWLLSSSHPCFRALVKRKLYQILRDQPQFISIVLEEYKTNNDPYILEGIYNSVYGFVLTSIDTDKITRVAEQVYKLNFENKAPFCDVLVRTWMLKILERASYLNSDLDLFEKSYPPYNSEEISLDEIEIEDTYFGESRGSKRIYDSLCTFEDFNRYIIGTNSNHVSHNLTLTLIDDQASEIEELPLSQMITIIAQQIKEMGWTDKLGNVETELYSRNRSENETERIGKKYQWMALYKVVAYFMDNYKVRDYWNKETYKINFPWLNRYSSTNFDITLYSKDEIDFADIKFESTEKQTILNIDATHFINDDTTIPKTIYFTQTDTLGEEWILLQSTYVWSDEKEDNPRKQMFLRHDSAFIRNTDVNEFKEWAKAKNFYGRWMPEFRDSTNFLLFEYPWSLSYKESIEENKWEKVHSRYDTSSPTFKLMLSTEGQLQENHEGLDNAVNGTTLFPCSDLMDQMQLQLIDNRHIVFDKDRKPASIYNIEENDSDDYQEENKGYKGLYIKKTVLDAYLKENEFSLVYYLIGDKFIVMGTQSSSMKDLSGSYIYTPVDGLSPIEELHVVEKNN